MRSGRARCPSRGPWPRREWGSRSDRCATVTIASPITPARSVECSMAFSRSRTRSWAVRSRWRMAASSAEAESSTSPLSSTLRSIRSRSAGAGSSASRTLGEVRPLPAGQPLGEQAGGPRRLGHVQQLQRGQPAAAPGTPDGVPRTSRAPPMLAWACSSSRRTASSVWSCSSATWMRVGDRQGRLGQLARRSEGGQLAEHADDGVELQGAQRARRRRPHRPPAQRRERCGSSAIEKRNGAAAQSPA